MEKALAEAVRSRAEFRCEYCQMPQSAFRFRFPIDHILACQHGGPTESENLALARLRCNAHKGPNLAGIDNDTGMMVRLFHPRQDSWQDHFTWHGPTLVGLTAIGRATIAVLAINHPNNLAVREALMAEGAFPAVESQEDS